MYGDGKENQSFIVKLEAVVDYLSHKYFSAICEEALNIIFSIPVWTVRDFLPPYALTSVTFHVHSQAEVTLSNWAYTPSKLKPILVVLGMSSSLPMPPTCLDSSLMWIVQGNKGSYGNMAISQRVFLHERLLNLLSRVNALTTLIPFPNMPVLKDLHDIKLLTLAEYDKRNDHTVNWELQLSDGDDQCLKYLWKHCQEWRHIIEGSKMERKERSISCTSDSVGTWRCFFTALRARVSSMLTDSSIHRRHLQSCRTSYSCESRRATNQNEGESGVDFDSTNRFQVRAILVRDFQPARSFLTNS